MHALAARAVRCPRGEASLRRPPGRGDAAALHGPARAGLSMPVAATPPPRGRADDGIVA